MAKKAQHPRRSRRRRRNGSSRRRFWIGVAGTAALVGATIYLATGRDPRPPSPGPESPETQRALAAIETRLNQGSFDEAITLAEAQLRRDPEARRLHYALGVALAAKHEPARAADHLREELRRDPEHLDSRIRLARALVETGERDQAIRVLRQALDRHPGDPGATLLLARTLRAAGRPDQARELLEASTDRIGAAAWSELGALHAASDELDQAEAAYRRALAIDPDHADAVFGLGRTLVRLGREQEGQRFLGRHAELEARGDRLEALRHRTVEDGSDAAELVDLGRYQLLEHDVEAATATFRRALERDPGSLPAMVGIGQAQLEAGRAAEAASWLAEVTEKAPDRAEPSFFLGLARHLLGDFAGAQQALTRSRELAPWGATEYLFLGNVLASTGALADAELALRESLGTGVEIPEARYKLGLVLQALDRPAEARVQLERFQELEPRDPRGPLLMGVVRHRAGDTAGAEESFRRALDRLEVVAPGAAALEPMLSDLRRLPGGDEAVRALEALRTVPAPASKPP